MDETVFEYISGLGDKLWQNMGNLLSDHGFEILTILVAAWVVKKFGGQLLSRIFHSTIRADLYPTKADRLKRLETIDSITNAILRVGVFAIAAIMIVGELGVNTTPIIASAGVIGIALGFGAQSLIKDFTNGIFTIVENQYRVGDVVRLNDAAGKVEISGTVEAITIRTTVLRGLDGTVYHVPNGSISTTANMTMGYGGFEEDILFDPTIDVGKLSMLINRIGTEIAKDPKYESKVKEPPHFERIIGIDVNGIKVKVVARTSSNDSWEIKGEFYRRLINELKKQKIDFPSTKVSVSQPKKTVKSSKS